MSKLTDWLLKRNKDFSPITLNGKNMPPEAISMFRDMELYFDQKAVSKDSHKFIELLNRVNINNIDTYSDYLSMAEGKVWATFLSCHLVASVLTSTVFNVMKRGEELPVDPTLNDLSSLIVKPNRYDTWEELIYQWVFHMKCTGNAYWLKDQVNPMGQPLEIYPLLPQYVIVVPDEYKRVKEYRYQVNGACIVYQPEDIIHFRRPKATSLVMGQGDISAAVPVFQNFIGNEELSKNFIEHGGMPSGVLTRKDQLDDDEEWKQVIKKWRTNYEGKKNAGKTVFLNGDWEYIRLGMTTQELQSLESSKWSVEQIFLTHGVPLSVAGVENSSNYATAKQDNINFRNNACKPLADFLIGKLNSEQGLSPKYGEDLYVDYDMAGLVDIQQIIEDYSPLVELGAMTPNELREKAGMAKTDDPFLDQFFVKSSLVPLAMAGMSMGSDVSSDIESVVAGINKEEKRHVDRRNKSN